MDQENNNAELPDNPNRDFEDDDHRMRLKIIGVGGAGNNAVDRIKLEHLDRLDLAVVNTDEKVLGTSPIEEKLLFGCRVTRGLSAGGEAVIGREAAESDLAQIETLVAGIDMIFLIAGLGGGTGSGALPVIAETAVKKGALVIAFVTLPFLKEGARRYRQAEESLSELRKICHAVIPLPNELLLRQIEENAPLIQAFAVADDWIYQGVHAIWSILFRTGLINVDFAALKKVFQVKGGKTLFGVGQGEGNNYVDDGIENLINCPLLNTPEFSTKADNLVLNIIGGPDLAMSTIDRIMAITADKFGSKDNITLGALIDDDMHHQINICVLGTTDINSGKTYKSRRNTGGLAPVSQEKHPAASTPANISSGAKSKVAKKPGKRTGRKKATAQSLAQQEEFLFTREDEQRGYFEQTEKNLWEDEDLDIPTFKRRGIKIQL